MQRSCWRYELLLSVLEGYWGRAVSQLFQQAWWSGGLAECATFGEWLVTLPEGVPVTSGQGWAEVPVPQPREPDEEPEEPIPPAPGATF